jgi:hypothetical protein
MRSSGHSTARSEERFQEKQKRDLFVDEGRISWQLCKAITFWARRQTLLPASSSRPRKYTMNTSKRVSSDKQSDVKRYNQVFRSISNLMAQLREEWATSIYSQLRQWARM